MILFFDLTLLGVYYLVKPIYELFDINESGFSSKDHALVITWFIHSANINNIVRIFIDDSFYFRLVAFGLMTILVLYSLYIYNVKKRLSEITEKKRALTKKVLICVGTVLYSSLSIYLFF